MYIDIVNYFMTKNPNTIIASCDTCRHIYSITADEIEILSSNKTNYKIYMFTCPNCGERLILPEKEMSKFFDEPKISLDFNIDLDSIIFHEEEEEDDE